MQKKLFLPLALLTLLALIAVPKIVARATSLSAGTWSLTGALTYVRMGHTATLLLDGNVLVVGGYGDDSGNASSRLTSAELYDPIRGMWSLTGSLPRGYYADSATLLQNGQVLVIGGAGAALYDPVAGTWSRTGSLSISRDGHTATLLPDGEVLVAGGNVDQQYAYLTSAELYDPVAGTWSPTGSMSVSRWHHTATLLRNGKVLVAGGIGRDAASAELYDPVSKLWSPTGSMVASRAYHTATLLQNGLVLATGGEFAASPQPAELYDPASGKWLATGNMSIFRDNHTATLMPDGKVLVAGGLNNTGIVASAQLYDPANGTWSFIASMITPRTLHTATLLPDGKVLVAGGRANDKVLATAELFPLAAMPQPVLHLPASIVENATGLQGNVVTYAVTASEDGLDASQLMLSCTPASGQLFPSKMTSVQCRATDPAGHTTIGNFLVNIKGEAHQIGDVIQQIRRFKLSPTTLQSDLDAPLMQARDTLDRENETTSCQHISDFTLLVHQLTGTGLTQDQSNQLLAASTSIESLLGCHMV